MGILFDVHTEMGNRYQEKYYQRAVNRAFRAAGLFFEEQIAVDLMYKDNKIGKYILDFIVENKVVVELKTVVRFHRDDIKQVLLYLKEAKLSLGILVNFRSEKLTYKRILNPEVIREHS
ncbi:MAG: GxxExxY protein [Elusimicrobia bacterium CG06_land_8_20_14_3_00_38_11]|nr:MAG: GxxExxY protein [Elusimicrobia bacterium CG06_land_8_20_14_3_00_38_11]